MKFKFVRSNAITPTRGSEHSAGLDLYACIDAPVDIMPGRTGKVGTGIAVALPEGTFGAVFPRSGLATKKGLRLANSTGIIDCDYRGEIIVVMYNDSNTVQTISPGDRIAQLVVIPYIKVDMEPVESLDDTARGTGGFGSTGI